MTRKLTRNYSLRVVVPFFAAGTRFGLTKLAAATVRGAMTLAVLFALPLIAALPAQAQIETVLHNFCVDPNACNDGALPLSNLTFDGAGNLYGTTSIDQQVGGGTVFELLPNGNGGWNEKVLYFFPFSWNPAYSRVIFDSLGNLYGTTSQGGAYGYGVVFELSPVGGTWTETDLYSFTGGSDGGSPQSGVTMDPAGNLWVITPGSGCCVPSTVDELSPSGGGWTEQTIATGDLFWGDVVMDASGNIFCSGWWNVVELTPNGGGGWTKTVIWPGVYGAPVYGTPVLDKAGNLYFTTGLGGAHCGPSGGCGAVYKLSPGKTGWTAEILYSFKGGTDGKIPVAGVVLDAAGNIYGTTSNGGTSKMGTVYELVAPVGAGSYKEKVLWSFNGTDGADPTDSLILDSAGNLYGTAEKGGSGGWGVAFEVTPPTTTTTTLTSSPNPSTYGQAVIFTAVVTSIVGAPPDGETVKFKEGTTLLGTGILSGGSASFTTSTLPAGTNAVTAVYGGDPKLAGSTSNTVKQVVKKIATTTSLSSFPNPSTYGQAVTFTAVVTSKLGAPPDEETVTFKEGTTVLGTGSLSGGSASFTTSALPVGTDYIKAVYGGDTKLAKSTSNTVKQVVN